MPKNSDTIMIRYFKNKTLFLKIIILKIQKVNENHKKRRKIVSNEILFENNEWL